jgi:hypothetical protein
VPFQRGTAGAGRELPGRPDPSRDRVIEDLATLPGLEHAPWSSRYLQGLLDVPFLSLTPGTRSGIIHDERYAALLDALQPLASNVQSRSRQANM